MLWWTLQARTVFFMSMVMVMGPTPPGTGVMALATSHGFLEGHVALEDAFAVGGLTDFVHADVDHHGAGFDHVTLDIFA